MLAVTPNVNLTRSCARLLALAVALHGAACNEEAVENEESRPDRVAVMMQRISELPTVDQHDDLSASKLWFTNAEVENHFGVPTVEFETIEEFDAKEGLHDGSRLIGLRLDPIHMLLLRFEDVREASYLVTAAVTAERGGERPGEVRCLWAYGRLHVDSSEHNKSQGESVSDKH